MDKPYSKTKEYYREYRKKNLEKIRERSRNWARKHPKPYVWNERKKETQRRYRLKHREEVAIKRRISFRNRLKNDVNFRLKWLLRARTTNAFKKGFSKKAFKTIELLGCSIETLRKHIEDKFTSEMNWNNHGIIWEIDHIIPISSFDLRIKENQKLAFHYTNLQPLIKEENRTKGSKII